MEALFFFLFIFFLACVLYLIFTIAFCFVPPNRSLHLSNKHKHTHFIYHLNLLSLFFNELLARSHNYLTLMEHLFSPTLPLLHHTCLLKYLCCCLATFMSPTSFLQCHFLSVWKRARRHSIIWLRRHPVDGAGITSNLSPLLRMKFN